jgi:TetR/AcrR family transcriptional regulator, ethionamide resistance regulator
MSHTFADRRLANRRRRTEAREQILAVARRELRVRPFRELSVDELMQATGLSRTAFYRYFPDREAVLVDLLEEMWGEFAEARDADPDVTSPSSLARLGQLIADNRTVLKAVADAAPGDEDVERAYRAFMHSYLIDDLTARIVEAQGRSLAAGLEPELAGEALGWMAERLVTQSLDRDPAQVLDTIVAILVKCLDSVPAPAIDPAPGAGRNRRTRSAAKATTDPSGAPRQRRQKSTEAGSGEPRRTRADS